jgi:phosphonate transport system substrate-binding protein
MVLWHSSANFAKDLSYSFKTTGESVIRNSEPGLGMSTAPSPHRPVPVRWRAGLIRLLGSLVLLGAVLSNAMADYTLAVVPQSSPADTYQRWAPFAEQLQQAVGQHLQLRVYRTFEEFEIDLVNGRVDFAYMNPYQFLMARKAQGYVPLVRDGSRQLSGLLVVRRDSPIQSVQQLNGQELGFPDPNAFGASLYMRALLAEKEHIHFTARYLTTHANVYRHVILGSVAAGAGVNLTLANDRPETRAALRVLYETPGTVPHPLCAHPRIPEAVREAMIQAILAMAKDENGRALLQHTDLKQPVRANYARDYQPLEKLKLQKYVVQTQLPLP